MDDVASEALQPSGKRYDFVALCLAEKARLEQVMRIGTRPDMAEIAGWEFKGYTLTQLSAAVGIAKFKTGFCRNAEEEDPAQKNGGYKVSCHSNSLGEPWIERRNNGRARRHGWFDVSPVTLDEADNRYPNGVLLNYGTNKKGLGITPQRALREYVVQVYQDNNDLLLGNAYLALGPTRFFASFFVLERHSQIPSG